MLSRDALLAINKRFRYAALLNASVHDVVSSLCLRQRGCRGGEYQRRHFMARQCVTSSVNPTVRARVIPTIFGNRRPSDVRSQLSASQRDERSAVRRPCRTVIRRVNERREQDRQHLPMDRREQTEYRRTGRDVSRRRLISTPHRVRSSRLQVR